MQYELFWDIAGAVLALAAIGSAVSTMLGMPLYVDRLTLDQLTTHIVLLAFGFALTEGGVLQVYRRTLRFLSRVPG